jgi:hypothetical protein
VIQAVNDKLIHDFFKDEVLPDSLCSFLMLRTASQSNTKNRMTPSHLSLSLLIHQTKRAGSNEEFMGGANPTDLGMTI